MEGARNLTSAMATTVCNLQRYKRCSAIGSAARNQRIQGRSCRQVRTERGSAMQHAKRGGGSRSCFQQFLKNRTRGRTWGLADLMAAANACEHPPGVPQGGPQFYKAHRGSKSYCRQSRQCTRGASKPSSKTAKPQNLAHTRRHNESRLHT
jgi:hypothetical protein